MSWLTKRVQMARLRGKNRTTQVKKILRRLRVGAGGDGTSRFLSGALNRTREPGAPAQLKGEKEKQV